MEDRKKTRDLRYVRNTDGCDVRFDENGDEFIPVNLFLTTREMEEVIQALSYVINSTPGNGSHSTIKKVIESIFSQIK